MDRTEEIMRRMESYGVRPGDKYKIVRLYNALTATPAVHDAIIGMIDAADKRITELEQENERLRAQCGLRQIHGYRECMDRAAEIADKLCREFGIQLDIAKAIRAGIDDAGK